MKTTLFLDFWSRFSDKSLLARRQYFDSLSKSERHKLILSFYSGGWNQFFAKIYVDFLLSKIKEEYDIDLIDLRIKAIKFNKVFLIEKHIWDRIEELVLEWQDLYDADVIFAGLLVTTWGRHKQFCKIRARRHMQWR